MKDFIKQFFDIKFWKFIMVGILNTIVGMGLQFLFFNLCGWDEWISSIVGYILGSILSYFLNKYFTFQNKEYVKSGAYMANVGIPAHIHGAYYNEIIICEKI